MIWQIATATGWSIHDIMWKINYQTLKMMLADAPHYEQSGTAGCRSLKGRKGGNAGKSGKKGKDAVSFFQSMMKTKDADK